MNKDMKVNFNKTFKDYKGDDLMIGGKSQLMADIIAQCLFNGEGVQQTGSPQENNMRKIHCYDLCMRIMQTQGDLSLTVEDALLIKESVTGLTPGCYSQIVTLIDK